MLRCDPAGAQAQEQSSAQNGKGTEDTLTKAEIQIIQNGEGYPSGEENIKGNAKAIDYGGKFSRLCKLNKSKLCYFMVWPSIVYYYTFEDVIKNHQDAALINKAILLPVGAKWKDDIDKSNNYNYYRV